MRHRQTPQSFNIRTTHNYSSQRLSFKKLLGIQTVYAEAKDDTPQQTVIHENIERSPLIIQFAHKYIQKETGLDRLSVIFKRDHQFKFSHEVQFMTQAIMQTYFISFMVKYVPTWYETRREFIKDHHGTVFRTKTQALKLMSDTVLLKSLFAAGRFALKVTTFSSSMLIISQVMSAYRNETSPLEYTVAAGVTGAFLRLNMGIRGMISGSILAGVMGTFVGGLITVLMRITELTQEERHLEVIMDRLEMERSLIGDEEFKKKMLSLMNGPDQVTLMAYNMKQ